MRLAASSEQPSDAQYIPRMVQLCDEISHNYLFVIVCDLGEGDMAADTITFDEVLQLVQRLSPTDQVRLRAVLPRTDEDAARAIQRQKNQAAIDLLDSWRAEATEATDVDDDDWWEAFVRDIDADRLSSRPLFPDQMPR